MGGAEFLLLSRPRVSVRYLSIMPLFMFSTVSSVHVCSFFFFFQIPLLTNYAMCALGLQLQIDALSARKSLSFHSTCIKKGSNVISLTFTLSSYS